MKSIEEAIKERDKFLEDNSEYLNNNPKMQKYVEELNEILNKAPPKDRIEVLNILMKSKLSELKTKLTKLQDILEKFNSF
jgi:hypothetical protein